MQRAEQANRSRAGSAAAAVQRAPLPLCRERRCAEGALVQRERLTEAEARESWSLTEASLTEAEARESEASLTALTTCRLRRAA